MPFLGFCADRNGCRSPELPATDSCAIRIAGRSRDGYGARPLRRLECSDRPARSSTRAAPSQSAPSDDAGGQAQFDLNRRDLKSDHPITISPVYKCHPPGLPYAYTNGGYPFEIVQTPQRIYIFYESAHLWREIWMDGREIPKDSDPLWMGYSVGHWDGGDLVVETANFNDKTWIDNLGRPHSDAMRLTERFHRPDHGHLEIAFLIDDPKFYTATWPIHYHYDLKPTWEIGESFCIPEDQQRFLQQNVPGTSGNATPDN